MVKQPNELYHHGVKGMKWGQHIYGKIKAAKTNKRSSQNREKAREARAAKQAEQAEKEKLIRSGNVKQILKNKNKFTNEELQRVKDRLDLEQKISELNKSQTSRGQKLVYDILEGASKNIGQQTVAYFMGTGVNKVFAQILDDPAIINPKKGQKDK